MAKTFNMSGGGGGRGAAARLEQIEITETVDNKGPDWETANGVITTALAAVDEIMKLLERSLELGEEAADPSKTRDERKALQAEFDLHVAEIDSISEKTQYNGVFPIDGSLSPFPPPIGKPGEALSLVIGVDGSETVEIEIGALNSKTLGIDWSYLVDNNGARAQKFMEQVKAGIETASTYRAGLVEYQKQIAAQDKITIKLTQQSTGKYEYSSLYLPLQELWALVNKAYLPRIGYFQVPETWFGSGPYYKYLHLLKAADVDADQITLPSSCVLTPLLTDSQVTAFQTAGVTDFRVYLDKIVASRIIVYAWGATPPAGEWIKCMITEMRE